MADFGDILRNIGEFGLFQKLTLLALCLPSIIVTFHFASVYFTQSDPERHCNTDWILAAAPNLTSEEQLNLTLPREEDGTLSRCRMFVPVDWDIDYIREYGLNQTTGCTDGWVYGSTLYEATIVTDFDLVCDQANLLQVAQTVLMAGFVVGCLLFGPFAESFGRKRATQIPVLIMFIFSGASGLCPSFYLYLASQFLVGVGYGGYRLNALILATEWIGMSKRSWASCLIQLCGAFGQCVLAGLIYFIRNWRVVQLVTAAVHAVIAIYIWFILESARWLLGRGRRKEAKQLITKVAAINKRTIPESLLEKISETESQRKEGVAALIKSSVLRKNFLTLAFAWFALNVAYFSTSLNVGKFGMNVFLTQLIFGASELPAHILCIWLLEALGRRVSLMSTLLIGGFSCILILAVPEGNAVAVTVLVTIGRVFLNWAASICGVYVQELFPTSFRQTASGLGNIVCRVGSLVSPLINMLEVYHPSIPTIIFSSISMISGALCFLLPETRRTELPDSINEAEGNGNKASPKKEKEQTILHKAYQPDCSQFRLCLIFKVNGRVY